MTCAEHDWVAKIDLRQIETHRAEIFEGVDEVVVNLGSLIDGHIVEEYETSVVCGDCGTEYPAGERELVFQ